MSINSEAVKAWRRKTKDRIAQAFGGCCAVCGYSKSSHAFDLHHLNPNEKEFTLGNIRANSISWERIVVELRKCVMLCANCHREFHGGLVEIPNDAKRFDEALADYKSLERKEDFNECPVCRKPKSIRLHTCSYECSSKKKFQLKWGEFDLFDLHVIKKLSNVKIAEMVGCSDAAVIKKLKKLGIYKQYLG